MYCTMTCIVLVVSSVGGLTDVLYNDMHCTCYYLFDTVWHEIFAGFDFCNFCHNLQKKIPAKYYSPQKFVTQTFTPLLKLSRLLFNAKVRLCIFIQNVPFV